MYETVKNHDLVGKMQLDIQKQEDELGKIYDSIIDIRKVHTDESNNQKGNNVKTLGDKVIDLEGNYLILKTLVDELKGEDFIEADDNKTG